MNRDINVKVAIRLEFDLVVPEYTINEWEEKHGMEGGFAEYFYEIDTDVAETRAKEFLADRIIFDSEEAASWITENMELTEATPAP